MEKIYIDYGKRINSAILHVVREILKDLSKSKISSHHCFYITFKTKSEGVKIPAKFLKEYPDEMTIVLQNQYWNLKVENLKFSVTLLFNKKKETLEVPFDSVVKFYDPFVKFSIQLELRKSKNRKRVVGSKKIKKNKQDKENKEKIITLDDFRKK